MVLGDFSAGSDLLDLNSITVIPASSLFKMEAILQTQNLANQ
jgi:hypothetical protein